MPDYLPDSSRLSVGNARFLRDARLTGSAQFQRVFKRAQLRSTDALLTVLATTNGLAYPRIGLAISRKAVRRAVDRNRIKRLIRESFRLQQQQLGGLDIVLVGKSGIARQTNNRLRAALAQHWTHLSHQCEDS